jgi:hypothetical protein
METQSLHEDLRRDEAVKAGSERSFGVVFAVVFVVVGLWPLIDGGAVRIWALVIGALFVTAAMVAPGVLRPFNRLWFLFGMALHKVVSPLALGILFYLTVTPMALLMRLAGKDPLRLKFDRQAKSYWIERHPAGPAPESMRYQF